MAGIVEEECLCENFSDHNISNNGQLAYRHCHIRGLPAHHDKLFLEQEVDSFSVQKEHIKRKSTDETDKSERQDLANILSNGSIKTDINDRIEDGASDEDVEIIIFLIKGSDEINVDVVSKTFMPNENQVVLSATFEVGPNIKLYDQGKLNKTDLVEERTEKTLDTSEEINTNKDDKHVHFQAITPKKHRPSLRSHKMVKDGGNHTNQKGNTKEFLEKDLQKDKTADNDKGKSLIEKSENNIKSDLSYNNEGKGIDAHAQRSSSECDLKIIPERNCYKNPKEHSSLPKEKKIIILRRNCDIKIAENSEANAAESKERKNVKNISEIKISPEIHQKQSSNDKNNVRTKVYVSSSHVNASLHSERDKFNESRRSKSNVDLDDSSKITDRKLKEKQKKKLKLRKKRQCKMKIPKTEMEIYQRQIETGQLRSMFSRYKTEGLRFLKLKEVLHKGTFSTKYKASFQNKQVVLTIYSEDLTGDINALDMAHMGNSYFVLGFTDCMTGPYGSIWFMSLYHPLGDLQKMLSRDPYHHVIGERHSQFITAGVLFGVDYLHQHEIVHGNIKPSKVLINALGYPVLTGFVKMEDNPEREGSQAYTPAYVAPEHLRGNRSEAIDIFSVGCMAYEIITGSTPFDGHTREQTLLNIQKACRPVYDPELFSLAGELFIDSCIRRNPKERFFIGEERCNLVFEEWFSTLNWKDLRRQTIRSPVLDALQKIESRVILRWEEKSVQFQWGRVMDVMCPYTPSLEFDEDTVDFFYIS